MKICLLGASFDAGNLGLGALAEGSVKCILNRWPDAKIVLLGHSRAKIEHRLRLFDREVEIEEMPIRFCKNVFLPCHFCVLLLNALLLKMLPLKRFANILCAMNPHVKALVETDLVCDVTGGDSFSDIYGIRRFIIGSLRKLLVLQFDKKLIMLPQTYGPFRRPLTRVMAKYILNRASIIYSRDKAGVEYVRYLLHNRGTDAKVRFAPDVAFAAEARRPVCPAIGSLYDAKKSGSVVVGLNISGLLFNGGYTQNNMFGLEIDYHDLINTILENLMKYNNNVAVLLVPHVFPPPGFEVEDDSLACRKVYGTFAEIYKNRIFLAGGRYDHNEIKHIIGLCDILIGSRMHACIAALSQGIPAIGLAYSEKFRGVFETVGADQFVVDMRYANAEQIMTVITQALEQREATIKYLKAAAAQVQHQILNIFQDIS